MKRLCADLSRPMLLIGFSLTLFGCASIGSPRMIGPDTYMIAGSGATNGFHNTEDEFLEKMQNHCQSMGKYPLIRKDNVSTQVMNAFGDKSYNGSLIYECITAADYTKSKHQFDEVKPIERIENRVIIEHK